MKNLKLIIIGLVVLGLSSCKDDEEAVVDFQNPEIEISGLSDGMVVWNDVPLKFEVNTDVEKIEVYINGSLEKTFEEAPFEHIWNTSPLEDGEFTIKAVAFSKNGSQKELSIKVKLKNTLLNLKVDDEYLAETGSSNKRGFVIITDAEGSTKITKEYFNGDEIFIKRPAGFSSEEFTLTNVSSITYDDGEKPRIYLETYFVSDIEEWLLLPEGESSPIGSANLTLTDLPDYDYFAISSSFSKGIYDDVSGIWLPLSHEPSDALITIHNGEEINFKLIEDLMVDEFREVSLLSVETAVMKTLTNPLKSDMDNRVSCTINGYVTDDYANKIYIYSAFSIGSDIELFYPENIFQNFRTNFDYSTDNEYYYSIITGQIPDAVILLDVDYNLLNSDINNFEITIEGEYDVFAGTWNNRNNESTEVIVDWTIISGENWLSLSKPDIETELKSIYPNIDLSTLQFDETVIIEASGFDGYQDYVKAASQSDLGIGGQSVKQAWIAPKTNGEESGRMKSTNNNARQSLRISKM